MGERGRPSGAAHTEGLPSAPAQPALGRGQARRGGVGVASGGRPRQTPQAPVLLRSRGERGGTNSDIRHPPSTGLGPETLGGRGEAGEGRGCRQGTRLPAAAPSRPRAGPLGRDVSGGGLAGSLGVCVSARRGLPLPSPVAKFPERGGKGWSFRVPGGRRTMGNSRGSAGCRRHEVTPTPLSRPQGPPPSA